MILCRVIGSLISTRKNEKLKGCKFLIVKPFTTLAAPETQEESFVAVDNIGAGVGEAVLVVRGSGARLACYIDDAPVDAAIIGIVDEGTYS